MAERTYFQQVLGSIASRPLLSLMAAALALALSTAAEAAHPPYDCEAAVEAELAKHGIAAADIRATSVERNRSAGEFGMPLDFTVWVQLKSCKGAIVIDLGTECGLQQTYAHGACKLR